MDTWLKKVKAGVRESQKYPNWVNMIVINAETVRSYPILIAEGHSQTDEGFPIPRKRLLTGVLKDCGGCSLAAPKKRQISTFSALSSAFKRAGMRGEVFI